MKKMILRLMPCLMIGVTAMAAPTDRNNLRAPAYPLVTIDPYTSAWSMSDRLYDSPVCHWTGKAFPLIGALKVDGKVYRFMGTEEVELLPVVPTSIEGDWQGSYTTVKPADDWMKPAFDDRAWPIGAGAFGTKINEPTAKTDWPTENLWVRRRINIDRDLSGQNLFLAFSNDDDAIFYINGVEVHRTGSRCHKNEVIELPPSAVALLHKGENLLAAECCNPVGNGLLDFGLQVPKSNRSLLETTARQLSVEVQAMQTRYRFACGKVTLDLTFTAPLFLDDLNLVSRPVNYLSYRIHATDGQPHTLSLYLEASPRWALDQPNQRCASTSFERDGLIYVKSGSTDQKILAKQGDDRRIDWGYFYLAGTKANTSARIGTSEVLRQAFVGKSASPARTLGENEAARMSLVRSLGRTTGVSGHFLIGYDDLYSVQYFGENLRPYWNAEGRLTIFDAFTAAERDYKTLLPRCRNFDRELMQQATAAGGRPYAELCALAYRQAIAAHKLVKAPDGDLLFLSKENNSNGSIGTVDVTYPSAPLFLLYNPKLAEGLMNHIYHYSESGRWTKPFPSHDVGTYPLANGQTYGGDMPVEEAGNMLILTAAVCVKEGSAAYAERHWPTLTVWADYLVEHGLDPENQLCTDDFAGHFAHNTNLSIKAILGIASYGRMAEMLGKKELAERYGATARKLAAEWVTMADDGDHFRLTFDKADTWSQKYNLVWDKLLGLNIFPAEVARKELASYPARQNRYGLPLDNRKAYTKTDWIVWTATMADNRAAFEQFIEPVYRFMNETIDRVPMSDWVFTDRPNHVGFKARSVVGGYFIKMLETNNKK